MFVFPLRLPLDFAKMQKFHLNRRDRQSVRLAGDSINWHAQAVNKTARAWSIMRDIGWWRRVEINQGASNGDGAIPSRTGILAVRMPGIAPSRIRNESNTIVTKPCLRKAAFA
jgi:hypothetical protein